MSEAPVFDRLTETALKLSAARSALQTATALFAEVLEELESYHPDAIATQPSPTESYRRRWKEITGIEVPK